MFRRSKAIPGLTWAGIQASGLRDGGQAGGRRLHEWQSADMTGQRLVTIGHLRSLSVGLGVSPLRRGSSEGLTATLTRSCRF